MVQKKWSKFWKKFERKALEKINFSTDELQIILKRRNLEICEHSILSIID